MKVSVVLPAFRRRFLREAIASVLAQSFGDFELIVVDDASPEGLEEVVREFDDPRMSYRRNEENIGGADLAQAWNRAMSFASGGLAVLASDDDVYEPDFLGEMVRLADGWPDVDVFHCRVSYIDADGRQIGMSEVRAQWSSAARFMYDRAARRLRQCAPEFLFRTEALRRIGGFVRFPRAWYSDDATWMALAKRGGVVYSARPLLNWRASGGNISSVFFDAAEKIKAGEMFRRWVKEYAAGLSAESAEDANLLAAADREIDMQIDGLALWVFRHAGTRSRIAALSGMGGFVARSAFAARMARAALRACLRRLGGA